MIACWFFMGSCFVVTFLSCLLLFFFVVFYVSFSQKSNCLIWFVFGLFGVLFFLFYINQQSSKE